MRRSGRTVAAGRFGLLVGLSLAAGVSAADFASLCADRAVIERVYYDHRLGEKPPVEPVLSPAAVETLVRQDARKEAALKTIYGVEITPAMVDAEVQRIASTTRAPEVLAEIKHVLGNDPDRFARTMARPIVVERELRRRFENDDKVHAEERRAAEQARASLLKKQPIKDLKEVTWQLTPPPEERQPESGQTSMPNAEPATSSSGFYSMVATAQVAQTLAPQAPESDRKSYFDDLDPDLQKVLRVQLKNPGDVSAVIETPGAFLVFTAKEINQETLRAASFAIPKRSYDTWLAEQPGIDL